VGLLTFSSGSFRVRGEPNFLRPFDLNNPRIVHDDLHNTEAKLLNLMGDNVQPTFRLLLPMRLDFRRHESQPNFKHY
jgi:hypothetical protein